MTLTFMRPFYAIFCFVLLALSGCNKDNTDSAGTANIIGSVNLYDEGTNLLAKDGMTVTVEGSSPLISAITDADGAFVLNNVPFETYTISFSKSGYGIFKKVDLLHFNSGSSTVITPSPSLGQVSTTTINSVIVNTSADNVTLSIATLPAPTSLVPRYIRVFFSRNASVSYTNYEKYTVVYKHLSNPADLALSKITFYEMGFTSGETVYARVYGDSFWSNDYKNVTSGKREFPNLNSSTVASVTFIVP